MKNSRGKRRIDDRHDWVAFEVRMALEDHLRVIPVLAPAAELPSASELPRSIAKLSRLQAFRINSSETAEDDLRPLRKAIVKILNESVPGSTEWAPAIRESQNYVPPPAPIMPWIGQ